MLHDLQLQVEVSCLLKHSTDLLTKCRLCGKTGWNGGLLVRRWEELAKDELIVQLGITTHRAESIHAVAMHLRPSLLG